MSGGADPVWYGDRRWYREATSRSHMPSREGAKGALPTIQGVADDLTAGRVWSRELVERAFDRVRDPAGEGQRIFIRPFEDQALAAAEAMDRLRDAGIRLSPLAGVPITVKDLCDIAGSTTLAGSRALADDPPAERDAPVVARLRAAGAVILGTTNMTEFAMGGLGLNPHYGTPLNPYDRATGRIPGGSSSGAAVSVADGVAVAALGTDTAGSIRMPAALCGLAGFKPTARRVPADGTVPLAASLDSIGPLGASVACCALFDAVLAAEPPTVPDAIALDGLRLGVPQTLVLDDLEPPVAKSFSAALSALSRAGATIIEVAFTELAELPRINRFGGFAIAEGYAWHRRLIEQKADLYDQIIVKRFQAGAAVGAAEYIDLVAARRDFIGRTAALRQGFDAMLMPTVPMIAPAVAAIADEQAWLDNNRLIIRNPAIANFLDGCALTVPCHAPGEAPVGLTLMGDAMTDRRLLGIGLSVERALSAG